MGFYECGNELSGCIMCGDSFTSLATGSFSRGTLPHGIGLVLLKLRSKVT
jgi:hypothetical protein